MSTAGVELGTQPEGKASYSMAVRPQIVWKPLTINPDIDTILPDSATPIHTTSFVTYTGASICRS